MNMLTSCWQNLLTISFAAAEKAAANLSCHFAYHTNSIAANAVQRLLASFNVIFYCLRWPYGYVEFSIELD